MRRGGGGGGHRYTLHYTLPSNIRCSALAIFHLLGLLWSISISTRLALVLALVIEQGKSFFRPRPT